MPKRRPTGSAGVPPAPRHGRGRCSSGYSPHVDRSGRLQTGIVRPAGAPPLLLTTLLAAVLLGCGRPGPAPVAPAHADTADAPATTQVAATPDTQALDRFITATMAAQKIPGLGVAVIKNNQVILAKGYGLADIDRSTAATTDTGFLISSCSKTLGAVVLMQLYEQGKFRLDDDINRYLPFSARNPTYPQKPITFRELLTHTSSLGREWLDENGDYSTAPGDPTVTLADYFRSYFTPGTRFYSDDNFLSAAPGAEYEYSNVGAALWAFLAERIAGMPFYQLSQQALFSKLGMTDTSWRLADLDPSKLATQYERQNGRLVAVRPFSYIEYPSGSIRTSVRQLAKFLTMFMNDGEYNGVRILKPETVAEMRRRQIPKLDGSQALVWYYATLDGAEILGHDGTDAGSGCYMFYRPSDKTGVILLMNVRNDDKADDVIASRLFDYATNQR